MGLAFQKEGQVLKILSSIAPGLRYGYMYTQSEKAQKAISYEYHIGNTKDINAELALSTKQFGLGINKHMSSDSSFGMGVATGYDKLNPELYVSYMRNF